MTDFVYRLDQGQQLNTNDRLVSDNRDAYLIMQPDGNLVLNRNIDHRALWATGTAGSPVAYAIMQGDGNLVCYDATGHNVYFATGTDGNPGSSLQLASDGNLRLQGPNAILWQTNTSVHEPPFNFDSGDCHVDVGSWMHTSLSYASGQVIGVTRTWSTILLRGFRGTVLPLLLDSDGLAMWPPNPDGEKHSFSVTGVWLGNHDRTDSWTNTIDLNVLSELTSIACINYQDPETLTINLNDVGIVGKTPDQISAAIDQLVHGH